MEQSTLSKWQSYIQPPTDDVVQAQVRADEDTSTEDYTVTTSGLVTTSSIIKLAMVGGFSVLVVFVAIGVMYFMSANSTPNAQAKQPKPTPKSRMESDKDTMLKNAHKRQTFSDRQDTIETIENNNKGKPNPANTPGQPAPAAKVTAPPTVTAPRIIYRNRPTTSSRSRAFSRGSSAQRTFRVQRPATVATQPAPEIDDPNYGFFTAPPAASSQPSQGKIQLTKSKHLALQSPKQPKGTVACLISPFK